LKALSDSPSEQLRCAQLWVAHEVPPSPSSLWGGEPYRHDRIRLAYISADFNNSAVASLMAPVFEHHDRSRFESIAVAFGPAEKTPMRMRLESAFEHFLDLRSQGDLDIAARLREMEIDIAVDLMGFTGECRSAIFAHRPAPLQVNYLGFPGTMGAPYIDYIVADPTVIPEEHQPFYAEKIAYLPDCYLPSDPARSIAAPPSRREAGLPDKGFVFASFNNSYKFSAAVFDIWMRLLSAIEDSVLWLPQNNASAMRNLAREAQLRGVSAARIVFAPPIQAADQHLARLSLADLFLDTLPYNAHTSACDALWAGVPLLTLLGNSFAGRAAASALSAVGLRGLIAHTPAAYEAMALSLARNPDALAEIRGQLARNREASALFDPARFTRHLELAFETMWARHQKREPPASFAVARNG
jgi:predicted O-linked N-acetylglucosamine transferase (SPINDLY family)